MANGEAIEVRIKTKNDSHALKTSSTLKKEKQSRPNAHTLYKYNNFVNEI